jgi:hypothetical protein
MKAPSSLPSSSKSQVGPSPPIYRRAHVHKLVGEQCAILVVKDGFEFRSACCLVNLIVDSRQTASRDLYRVVAVPRVPRYPDTL